MAYVNPQTGFTTKPNFPQILSNLAGLIQQKQAQGMANKQFEMQMQRDKARFDATMELETKKLEQAVKDAEARNKFTELQMKLMQLEEDRRVKEEEAMAAFGEARKGAFAPKEVAGTSPIEQGTARVQDYLKNAPQEGGLFGKIAGVLQGAPQVFAEQTQRQTAAPTYGSVGELGLAMLQQTDDPAVINKIMEMYPSAGVMDYQAYKSAIDAAITGAPLPTNFAFAQDYVNRRRELDEKLRLGQIDQVDYNSQMLPLQLEGLRLENEYKQKLINQPYGGGGGGGISAGSDTQPDEPLTEEDQKAALRNYLIPPETGWDVQTIMDRKRELEMVREGYEEGSALYIFANNTIRHLDDEFNKLKKKPKAKTGGEEPFKGLGNIGGI